MNEWISQVALALAGSPVLALMVKTTALLAAGLGAAALARRRSASVRHGILALTFACAAALPIASAVAPVRTVEVAAPAARPGVEVAAPAEPVRAVAAPAGPARAVLAISAMPVEPGRPAWVSVLGLVWVAGASLFLASLVLAFVRHRRIRAESVAWPEGAERLAALAAAEEIDRPVALRVSPRGDGPLTWGVLRHTIVVPDGARGWSAADLDRALRHELAHVRRFDWLVHAIASVLCAVYWFHPLVWVAWRRLRLDAERACDDAVLPHAEVADYADQLVTLAARRPAPRSLLAMAARSDLAARVHALLDDRQERRPAGRPAVALAFAAAVALLVGLAPVRVALAAPPSVNAALGRALFDAAARGDLAAVTELLDGGADPNAALRGDGSPLIAAARLGHLAVAQRLLERGARPDFAVVGDGTPLIMAAREGHLELARLLLDRGASINLIAPDDENPLIQASARGQLAMVKFLVERGADVHARAWAARSGGGGEWRTPLGQAQRGDYRAVVDYLRSAGAR